MDIAVKRRRVHAPFEEEVGMNKSIAAVILAMALLPAMHAQAADYAVQKRRTVAVRPAAVATFSDCWRGRFAFERYTPRLATAYAVKPVWVAEPVPCGR